MRREIAVAAVLVLLAGFMSACDDEGDTLVLDGLDCGLVRSELVGDWTVSFATDAVTLVDCTGADPTVNGTAIDTLSGSVLYTGTDVLGNDTSPSFQVRADRAGGGDDPAIDPEFLMNIGADSCQAFFRVWESDDDLFVQCIGNFDRDTGIISTFCDSAEVDTDADDAVDTTCSLSDTIPVTVSVN